MSSGKGLAFIGGGRIIDKIESEKVHQQIQLIRLQRASPTVKRHRQLVLLSFAPTNVSGLDRTGRPSSVENEDAADSHQHHQQ
jgi:hypothetical protein